MDVLAVHALAAEERNQRRMDVHYPPAIRAHNLGRQNSHVPGQAYEIHVILRQHLEKACGIFLVGCEFFRPDFRRKDAVVPRAIHGGGVVLRTDDNDHSAVNPASLAGVNDRLEVAAPAVAGHHDRDIDMAL